MHPRCSSTLKSILAREWKAQSRMIVPLIAMNLTSFSKNAITFAFLGRMGKIQLSGGALGLTFANVTGFCVLNGLCGAMEPICGQAYGARNYRLLHKTLLMTTILLLLVTIPTSFLWLKTDKILSFFGQEDDMIRVAKSLLVYLIPDLVATSLLCPLKMYLSLQGSNFPTMVVSAVALGFHVPVTRVLANRKGVHGVGIAVWASDFLSVMLLGAYVGIKENKEGGKWVEGGWFDQSTDDWLRLLSLSSRCCVTTCLEWWCLEILIIVAGRLPNASRQVGVLTIVLNFDYLLYSVMLSLSACATIRVSNELGANQGDFAKQAGCVSLLMGVVFGLTGGSFMVAIRDLWGRLFSRDKEVVRGVKRMMVMMGVVEIVNFPLVICGGIVRSTAKPQLAMYANVGGFYVIALPVAVLLAFKGGLGLVGLLGGYLVGMAVSLGLLATFVALIDWNDEALRAQKLASEST